MKEKIWDKLSIMIIIITMVVLSYLAVNTQPAIVGECQSYVLSTASLINSHSIVITKDDVDFASKIFPNYADYIQEVYSWRLPQIDSEHFLPYYGFYYSLCCIPMVGLLRLLGCNASYAFCLTNVLFMGISLIYTYVKLKADRKSIFEIELLLATSPVWLYYFWPSAEIFIFSMLVISTVSLLNGKYKSAGLFCSIAGGLNITVMAFGFIIVIDYLRSLYVKEKETNFYKHTLAVLKNNWKDILITACCFIPCFEMYIEKIVYNKQEFTPPANVFDFYTDRLITYIMDLNLGFWGWMPLLVVLFVLAVTLVIVNKKWRLTSIAIGFSLTICAYALMDHINCGMTGIARYNAWSSALLIIFIVLALEETINGKMGKQVICVILIMSGISTAFLGGYYKKTTGMNYLELTPQAKFVLDHSPELYNPYPATFISRTMHIDGAYDYTIPAYYADSQGYVRKLLVDHTTLDYFMERLSGDPIVVDEIKEDLLNMDYTNGPIYYNIGKNEGVIIKDE